MVKVVVRDKHRSDRRHFLERQSWSKESLRSCPSRGRCSLVPHWINQQSDTVNFEQRRRVPEPCHSQSTFWWCRKYPCIRTKRPQRFPRRPFLPVRQKERKYLEDH